MRKKTGILCLLCANVALAGTMGDVATWRPVGTLSLGPEWAVVGQTQTIFLQPTIQNTYIAKHHTSTLGEGELFVGAQRVFSDRWQAQVGLVVAGTTSASVNSDVWVDANPEFNNFTDTYRIEHAHIAAEGKVYMDVHAFAKPYVSGSLGVGFNRAYGDTLTTKLFQEIPPPVFTSHTTTALSYTLGAGLVRNLSHAWQVGMGYQFTDWGTTSLAAAPGQTVNGGLSLNHVYTNQLLFGLSYFY